MAVWLASFELFLRFGTWIQFAVAGSLLAAYALATDAQARALLRPSRRDAAIGLLAGVVLVALTHAAFHAGQLARARSAGRGRLAAPPLAYSDAIMPATRAVLIAVIASSEEIIFRGPLMQALPDRTGPTKSLQRPRPITRADLLRISAAYAASTITLGSPLLVACAFVCGVIWATLRVATRRSSRRSWPTWCGTSGC